MGSMFQTGLDALTDGTHPWDAATDFRVSLHTSSYTPDPDHDDMADTTNELSGGNYSRVALAGENTVIDDVNNQIECDATDATFSALELVAGQPSQAVVHEYGSGVDANAILMADCTLTTPPAPNGGDYVIQWSGEGVFKITVA